MAWQRIPGSGLWVPDVPGIVFPYATFSADLLIDATGEKIAFCGRVYFDTVGPKAITRVGFLFGIVVKAGGSGLTVSLQDVSAVAGQPMRPDDTQDQTVAIANADSGFASDLWYRTNALSATRSVNPGDLLAVVTEFDGGGRLGADSVVLRAPNCYGDFSNVFSSSALYTASWTQKNTAPNVVLEFSDGTFGTLEGAFVLSAIGSYAYKSNSNPDEYGQVFKFPFPMKVEAFWAAVNVVAATSDFDVVLYEDTTALATVSHDATQANVINSSRQLRGTFGAEVTLSKDTDYILAFKPTQAVANLSVPFTDVAAAAHWRTHGDGAASGGVVSRVDDGAWSAPDTIRRLGCGLRASSFDDGVGGGGGMLVHPGMTGGFRG